MPIARLARYREARKLSQNQLARITGIAQTTISAIERGEADPRLRTVIILSRALGVSIDELVQDEIANLSAQQ